MRVTLVAAALVAPAPLSLTADCAYRGEAAQSQRGRTRRTASGRRSGGKSMSLKAGEWGGPHARLLASDQSFTVEFDCAHGRVEGEVTLGANGRFEAVGVYVREGGPSRVDADAPDSVPARSVVEKTFRARYAGVVAGRTMTLTVTLVESGAEVGTFRLRHGRPASLQKCL